MHGVLIMKSLHALREMSTRAQQIQRDRDIPGFSFSFPKEWEFLEEKVVALAKWNHTNWKF